MLIWSSEIKELEKLYESLKGQLPDLEKELERLIKADDENMILLYSRRCLEVMITDLCECELKRERGTEPLKGIIDKLHKEKKIPPHIIASIHSLNELSTFGTHPKEFDPEQVKPVLVNLDITIKWYLKYKDVQAFSKQKTEEVKDETKVSNDTSEKIRKSYKKLILLISGAALVFIAILVLFVFNIIGSGRQIKDLEKYIAVLPFEVWNTDEEFQYLGNAIANEINTQLCIVKKFHVISWTSSSRYKGSDKPMHRIGKELGANFIIEGTIERQVDDISIHVQVINAKNDDHFWAHEFKDKWNNLIALRATIAKKVADVLNTSLTPEEKQLIERIPTKNITAYDLTLKAQEFYYQYLNNDRDTTSLEKAVQYCNIAFELDSGFALVYYWLGKCSLSGQYMSGAIKPFYLDTALYFFNKALKLDPNSAPAYAERGIYYFENNQVQLAFNDLNKSISISPNNSHAYYYLGSIYFRSRDYINALINLKKAEILSGSDEYLAGIYSAFYFTYLSIGDFQKAGSFCRKTEQFNTMVSGQMDMWMLEVQGKYNELLSEAEKYVSLYPSFGAGYESKATVLIEFGRIEEAEECIRLRIKYSDTSLNDAHRMGYVFWINGNRDQARKYFNIQINNCIESIKANNQYGQSYAAYDLAGVYATLENKEEAKKWLREYEKLGFQSGLHEYIKTDPLFDNLRNDEEFKEIVKRANEKADEMRARISEMEEQGIL